LARPPRNFYSPPPSFIASSFSLRGIFTKLLCIPCSPPYICFTPLDPRRFFKVFFFSVSASRAYFSYLKPHIFLVVSSGSFLDPPGAFPAYFLAKSSKKDAGTPPCSFPSILHHPSHRTFEFQTLSDRASLLSSGETPFPLLLIIALSLQEVGLRRGQGSFAALSHDVSESSTPIDGHPKSFS